MVGHFYVNLVILVASVLIYRAEKTDRQTDRKTPAKTLPLRQPSAWVTLCRIDSAFSIKQTVNTTLDTSINSSDRQRTVLSVRAFARWR